MARLSVASGLGGKHPAALLLEAGGRRLLLDCGEGPEPGVLPPLAEIGPVDAILLTHAHADHCAGLARAAPLGTPPVHATATTFRLIAESFGPDLVPPDRRRLLPEQGPAEIAGLPLRLGRAGHAPGGVWVHAALGGGVLYTGDWSRESALLPFDPPPPAAVLATDASYGDRDEALGDQIGRLAEAARPGAVLPVPAAGRGPEVALSLAARGLRPRLCPRIAAELADLAAGLPPADRAAAAALLATASPAPLRPDDVIVAAGPNAESGVPADLLARRAEGFRFVFSSHVPKGTPAADLLARGEARWLPWNVHPRLSDTLALAEEIGATRVVPLFADPAAMPRLRAALGPRHAAGAVLELADPAPCSDGALP